MISLFSDKLFWPIDPIGWSTNLGVMLFWALAPDGALRCAELCAHWQVPFLPGTPCCLEHLPDVTCVSQSNCSKGFGGALGWSGASVLAAAGCQAFFYMKGSGADLLPGRRWCWCLKMTAPALCLFFALHAVVYMNFLHIWEKVTPAQTARVCVWWAMWSLLAMQATVCSGLSYKKDRC